MLGDKEDAEIIQRNRVPDSWGDTDKSKTSQRIKQGNFKRLGRRFREQIFLTGFEK